MVGFADQLDPAERWDLVNHLLTLARAPTASASRPAPVAPSQLTPASPADEGAILRGRLVFGPDFDNNLWLLKLPDGKPEPLMRLGPKEFTSNPAWSPDGRQIAFSYYRLPNDAAIPVPDGSDLYLMNADGSALRPLRLHETSGTALQYPAWAADGAAIYVSRAAAGGARSIDRVVVQSGEPTRVVAGAAFPALSPDGLLLAYVRYPTPPERGESLWLSAPDGSGPREIIAPSAFAKYFGLRFSPEGRQLLFAAVGQPPGTTKSLLEQLRTLFGRVFLFPQAYANGDIWDLWIVDLDGRNLRPVTALGEDMPVAAWSPDGKHIAFLGGGSASSAEAGVTIISPKRKDLRRLTTQPGHRGLDWAPLTPEKPPASSAR
jgi:Tol biopolymer transport system component